TAESLFSPENPEHDLGVRCDSHHRSGNVSTAGISEGRISLFFSRPDSFLPAFHRLHRHRSAEPLCVIRKRTVIPIIVQLQAYSFAIPSHLLFMRFPKVFWAYKYAHYALILLISSLS